MEIHNWKMWWIIMAFQSPSVGYLGIFLLVMISCQIFFSFDSCKYCLYHKPVSLGQQKDFVKTSKNSVL